MHQVQRTTPTGADFFGYTRNGRVILIECKEYSGTSLPMGTVGLKAHQFVHLLDCHRANGIALVAWKRKDEVAVIEMDVVMSLTQDRKSIPWKRIPQTYVKPYVCEARDLLEPHLSCKVKV